MTGLIYIGACYLIKDIMRQLKLISYAIGFRKILMVPREI